MRNHVKTAFLILIASFLFSALTRQAAAKSLFVVDGAGVVTVYSADDFKKVKSFRVPEDLFSKKPTDSVSKGLLVSRAGRVLYYVDEKNGAARTLKRTVWYRDGEREFRGETSKFQRCFPSEGMCLTNDMLSPPALDAQEPVFYWWINRGVGFSPETGIKIGFFLYRVRFDGGRLAEEPIAKITFDDCICDTGACEETCPVGEVDIPKEGIGDHVHVVHFIMGQLGSSEAGDSYFEKRDGGWAPAKGEKYLERPSLDALYDSGCCGWINESSDMLYFYSGGVRKEVYDEWKRFNNRSYDISFYPANPELSPGAKWAGYTITADPFTASQYRETGALRLSSDGKDDPEALKGIRKAVDDLPMAEVEPLTDGAGNSVSIKNAEFIGWADGSRFLFLKDGQVFAFDMAARRTAPSGISAASSDSVFLR